MTQHAGGKYSQADANSEHQAEACASACTGFAGHRVGKAAAFQLCGQVCTIGGRESRKGRNAEDFRENGHVELHAVCHCTKRLCATGFAPMPFWTRHLAGASGYYQDGQRMLGITRWNRPRKVCSWVLIWASQVDCAMRNTKHSMTFATWQNVAVWKVNEELISAPPAASAPASR